MQIEDDWVITIRELISAEIFTDFLEMAEYLLENKYKEPATVIIGSVLEEHLRHLCNKNGIDPTYEKEGKLLNKKADKLNTELASSEIYNKLDQKSVTAWVDLRNKTAHGQYTEYEINQVKLMYTGVSDFIRRTIS